jgi:hypothetical protein
MMPMTDDFSLLGGVLPADEAIRELRAAYARPGVLRSILDLFGSPNFKPEFEVSVDEIERSVPWGRADVVHALKNLQNKGWGRFFTGRRGAPSRFRGKWRLKGMHRLLVAVTAASNPSDEKLEAKTDVKRSQSPATAEMIEHSFRLRPDLLVCCSLPANITRNEAARFASFVQSIPFGE